MNDQTPVSTEAQAKTDWWRGGVIYQIYPRSFQDSDGDGIGDLNGITRRLEYIASLGVDAIWISPFFTSPMKDFGYDVSDYCDVDPMFGSLGDFDGLMDKAHKLGLKVMIDLVLSHTSDEHPWFQESRASRDNPKSEWYVWADPKDDGTPPNNWLSIFGGPAWQWDARRQQYYLHNFLVAQPDLNFHCEEVQDALLDVARFWLDRGVDGFRLDTINFYVHDKELRSNPALPLEERNDRTAPQVNPYNHQNHLYSKSQPENIAFLERLRKLTDEYEGRTMLGEVGESQRGLEILGEYTKGDGRVHMCYAFEFLENRRAIASWVVETFEKLGEVAPDGWACWAFSNHDVRRHATRWDLSDIANRAYVMMMMAMRGSACLYQGEELGLHEADVPFEALQDPYGKEFWPEFKGRDGCRTPMVWEVQQEMAGFTNSTEPWLPVSPAQVEWAVDRLEEDPGSLLHHYRRAVALRRDFPVLAHGDQIDMKAEGDLLTFTRSDGQEEIFCAFNLGDIAAHLTIPDGKWSNVAGVIYEPEAGPIDLPGWGYVIIRREGE